jgi:hypothetical protein
MEKHPGSPQTIKQHLAAIKMLFDYLVISQREPDSPLFPAAIGKTLGSYRVGRWCAPTPRTCLKGAPKKSWITG